MASNIMKITLLILLLALGAYLWKLTPIERKDLIGNIWAEPMLISFEDIKQDYSEDDMVKEYHYLKFTCHVNNSQPELGDSACWSYIKSINGVPAKYVVFFIKNNIVSHIRITLKGDHHKDAYSLFEKKYGNPELVERAGDIYGGNIMGWMLPIGFLAMSENVTPDKEAIILWTSSAGQHLEKSSVSPESTSEDYASTLSSDCKNAYTASVAYAVDNPNAKNITLSNLIESGYTPSEGVTIKLDNLSEKGGTITCSGPAEWGVSDATITILYDTMKFTESRPIAEESAPSSSSTIFLKEPGREKTREEQIHFGTPVRADIQNTNNSLVLSSSQPPRELANNAEVILVSGYEPSNQNKVGTVVKVEVDRPGSKVLLVLTSYEKINWQVSASPSTIISGIVTWGYKSPTVTTPIATQGFLVNLPYAYKTENVNFKNLLNKLNGMFGINKIDVFRGSYSIPSVIRISSLDPPRVELTLDGPTTQKPKRDFTFYIIGRDFKKEIWSLTGPVQPDKADKNALKKEGQSKELDQEAENAEDTDESDHELNIMEQKIALSHRNNEIFRLHGDDLEIFNILKNTSEIVPLPPNFPRFSWAMDVAYDSKRDIVTVVTLGGEGFLYRFNAKGKKWIDFRSLSNIDICSLSYDKSMDRYVAWGSFGNNGQLFFISGEGNALFNKNVLPKLVGLGRLYDSGNGPSPCLKIAPNGNDIALIFRNGNIVKNIWCYYVENDTAVLTYKN